MLNDRKFSVALTLALALTLSTLQLGAEEKSLQASPDDQTVSDSVLPRALEDPTEEPSMVQEEAPCALRQSLDLARSEGLLFETAIPQPMRQSGSFCNCNSSGSCNDICGGPGVCHLGQCSGFYQGICYCY